MMLTTDIALTQDPAYLDLVKKFSANLTLLTEQFGAAWYKLMTRDMGPRTRCLGDSAGPARPWQMPLPPAPKTLPDFSKVKADIIKAISTPNAAVPGDTVGGKRYYGALLGRLAYQCASTYRETDYAGGCNGARIRFEPMKSWPENKGLDKALQLLEPIKARYKDLSWADLIVLAGTAAQEAAAGPGAPAFPFCGGRTDAADGANTDHLAPRKYINASVAVIDNIKVSGLTPAEAVALAGQLRSPAAQKAQGYSSSRADSAGKLSNEFFKVLLQSDWRKVNSPSGKEEYTANGGLFLTPSDLVIKQDPKLSAIAKEYAADNAKFLKAFAAAWTKLMNADRFKGPAGSVC